MAGYLLHQERRSSITHFARLLSTRKIGFLIIGALVLLALGPYLYLAPSDSFVKSFVPTKDKYGVANEGLPSYEDESGEPEPSVKHPSPSIPTPVIHHGPNSGVHRPEWKQEPPPGVFKSTDGGRHNVEGGLLYVDESLSALKHPIYQLIDDAKVNWDTKIKRQSKTLEDAVKEYGRRNKGRKPPKGFDHWWKYVQDNDVTLPDEFDQILKDLAPFRGFSPYDLYDRVELLTQAADTFTISIRKGEARISQVNFDYERIGGSKARSEGQLNLVKDVAKWIPDLDAVFNIHDTPSQFVSYGHISDLIAIEEDGEYIDPEEEADRAFKEWGAACPPHTPLYLVSEAAAVEKAELLPDPDDPDTAFLPTPIKKVKPRPSPTPGKSFISDHSLTMDLCKFPTTIDLHGATAGVSPEPQAKLMPVFSLSKTNLHSDIMVIPIEQWSEGGDAIDWRDKDKGKLQWRGRNTGGFCTNSTPWRDTHRPRLSTEFGPYELDKEVSVIPAPHQVSGKHTIKEALIVVNQGDLNEKLMDVGLAYEPIQCSVEDGTCDDIIREMTYRPRLEFHEEMHYKFILDIDGNAWSARFNRVLTSRALILKSTIFPEWWNDRIQPWMHYIPVKVDYSDVYDIMTFFRGADGTGEHGEDKIAAEIANAGRQWVIDGWRAKDMTAYMFRLYLEWARLLAADRSSMDYVLPGSSTTHSDETTTKEDTPIDDAATEER